MEIEFNVESLIQNEESNTVKKDMLENIKT